MSTARALGTLLAYLLVIGVLIVFLPIVAAFAIGTNYNEFAEKLSFLPGIDPDGGVKPAVYGFGYAFVIWLVLAVWYQGGDSTQPTESGAITPTPTVEPSSPSPTPQAAKTPTLTATSGPASTASATRTGTPTPPPTATATPAPTGTGTQVTVVQVVDGDTIDIRFQNGTVDTVRLLGVDTPEVNGDNDPAEFEGVPNTNAGEQCLYTEGQDASDFAEQRLAGETIRIRFDSQSDRRGSFGRLLAYVILDGQNFNYQLVAEGYARVYDSQFEQSERFYTGESAAQSNSIGVWGCRNVATPTPTDAPAETPSGSGQLEVDTVHANAEDNDHENLNDEYVVFENTGGSSLDIGGWTVEDEADHTYTVPSGTEVEAGETITLYTGSGTDSDTELYWGSDSAIWNNGGDTVIVTDESGNRVIEESYS